MDKLRRDAWLSLLRSAVARLEHWEARWPEPSVPEPDETMRAALQSLTDRLRDNYPFHHPRYAGQMLKPPHPLAWAALAVGALVNPNNHALDGGPATARMEKEAVDALASMFGWSAPYLGHLSASGTIANLEALWVSRSLAPSGKIAFCKDAHYTHSRMSGVLGVDTLELPADAFGRIDVEAARARLTNEDVSTLVVTLGTTGVGAVDPLHELLPMARELGVRVHADCAYGGFFTLLARADTPLVAPEPFAALAQVDSIVIDPHKHGLQPYGCGAVLYRDPSVGRFFAHDSPYTYFTSDEMHLGEVTLECSRPGAAAAALWTTLRAIPLEPDRGLGPMLARCRRAALLAHDRLSQSAVLRPLIPPETDIVCYGARAPATSSALSAATDALFRAAAAQPEESGAHLAKIRLGRAAVEPHWPDIEWDQDHVVLLRSVLMKPDHASAWPAIQADLERLCPC